MPRRAVPLLAVMLLLLISDRVDAGRRTWNDVTESLLTTAREHQRALEASIPARERDVHEATASLDRNSELFARGVIDRPALEAAARDVAKARVQLDATRQQ